MSYIPNSLAQELYDSVRKANINSQDFSSGEIRRSISTAYYAVFRLIIDDGLKLLFPDEKYKEIRNMWERRFTHTTVKEICNKLVDLDKLKLSGFNIDDNKDNLRNIKRNINSTNNLSKCDSLFYEEEKDDNKKTRQAKDDIAYLAYCFLKLHQFREEADYNSQIYLSILELTQVDELMQEFFQTWHKLKTGEPEAMNTLIALFLLGIKDKQG